MQPQFQYDPDIGYRFVPGLKTRVTSPDGGYLIQTNGQGFRCRHEFVAGADSIPRVLLFGDSFTAGDLVSNGQRYGDLLEQLLDPLQVYNFGLPGTGTDQHYIVYKKFAMALHCDAVVIAVLVENIRRIVSAYRPQTDSSGREIFVAKPYFEMADGSLVRRFDPVPREFINPGDMDHATTVDRGGRYRELRALVNSLGLRETVQRLTGYQPTPEYDGRDNPAWLLMRAILLEWRQLIRQPVVLMPLPLYQHVEGTADPSQYRARFGELARDGNFILHDPLDDLWSHSVAVRRGFRFKSDVHPTPAGHRAIADSLSMTLRKVLQRYGKGGQTT